MSKPLPHQLLQDIEGYSRMFRQYQWELAITTRIPVDVDIDNASEQLVSQILAPLAAHLKQKIATMSVVVPATSDSPAHIHTLALSFDGTLPGRNERIQEFVLNNIGTCPMLPDTAACIVNPINDKTYWNNITRYAAVNFASVAGASLNCYKKRLLAKRRVTSENK